MLGFAMHFMMSQDLPAYCKSLRLLQQNWPHYPPPSQVIFTFLCILKL